MSSLAGRRVAVLSTMGFERVELIGPRDALREAEATVHIVAPEGPTIRAFEFPEWADEVPVDRTLDEGRPEDYDALYLPGGIINPDLLRLDERALGFIRAFVATGKPIASMCHGPWLLISAGAVRGRRVAAWPSLRWDLVNAGATYVDEPVVADGPLVTARNPEDIPKLNAALLGHFAADVVKAA